MNEEITTIISQLSLQEFDLPPLFSLSRSNPDFYSSLKILREYISRTSAYVPTEYLSKILQLCKEEVCNPEISWILINLTAGPMCSELVELGVLEVLSNFIIDVNLEKVESGYWALSNIAGTDVDHRDLVCNYFLIDPGFHTIGIQQKKIWLLSNITQFSPFPMKYWYDISLIICKNSLICQELLNDCLNLLSNILLNTIYIAEVMPFTDFLLNLQNFEPYYYFSIFASLTSTGESEISHLLSNNFLQVCLKFFSNSSEDIQDLILQSIFNICIGPLAYTSQVISSGMLQELLKIINLPSSGNKEICIEIIREITKSQSFLKELKECGVINGLIHCINKNEYISPCICILYQFIDTPNFENTDIFSIFSQLSDEKLDNETRSKARLLLLKCN